MKDFNVINSIYFAFKICKNFQIHKLIVDIHYFKVMDEDSQPN